jgi:hypothetical protein
LEAALEARGIPVLFVIGASHRGRIRPASIRPGLPRERLLDLHQDGREEAYYASHPAPSVLAEQAERVAEAIANRGWLGATRPNR